MYTRLQGQAFPFAIISGNGLGASHASLAGLFPDHPLNAGQTSLAVNAANGNAVVHDKIFSIHDASVIEPIGMIWNSLDKQFRIATQPVIKENNHALTLTEPDGATVTYTLKDGVYIANKIATQGLSRIKKTDQGYERFFPGNGMKEIYNLAGRPISKSLPPDTTIHYDYQNETDVIITLPSGRKIRYQVDTSDATLHHLYLDESKLASYQFSADKQTLTTHIYQPDNAVYHTSYKQGDNNLIITSDDRTTASLGFNQEGHIQQCSMGENAQQSWHFTLGLSSRCMEVCDQDKKMIARMSTDINQHLEAITFRDISKTHYYQYSEAGQLLETGLCDANRQNKDVIQSMMHDPHNGLPLIITQHHSNPDNNIQKTCAYYSGQNECLHGVKLAEQVTQNGQAQTTWRVYNDKRQLCYLITPAGRVTQFVYETVSPYQLKHQKQAVTKRFTAGKNPPTLTGMQTWWEQTLTAEDRQSLQITQLGYDAYGRENEKSFFTSADNHGEGITTESKQNVLRTFDFIGRETKTEIVARREHDKVVSSFITTKAHDALDRVTHVVTGVQAENHFKQEQKTSYRANQAITEHANGLKETLTTDTAGRLLEHERVDTVNHHARVLSIHYPGHDIRQVKREDGLLEQHYHDSLGRLHYHLLPDRQLLHYQYDDLGRLTHENTYVLPEDFDAAQPAQELVLRSELKLEQVHLYDPHGQLVYDIVIKNVRDEQDKPQRTGYLQEHRYQLGKKIHTTAFAKPLNTEYLHHLSYHTMTSATITPDDRDRNTQYFYDADGVLTGTHQASHLSKVDENTLVQGYLQEYEVDGAGNRYHEIIYLQPSTLSHDLAEARPASREALHTWHWFDGTGQKIATMDADNYLTLLEYFADGKLKQTTQLFHPQTINTASRVFPVDQIKRDDAHDAVITYAHDDLRRTHQVTDHHTQLETHIEYDANNNEIKRVLKDLKEENSAPRITQKSYNAFDELEQEASARVSAIAENDKRKWTQHKTHPQTGLRLHTMDAKGNPTLYYYNAARLPVVEITANGAVRLFKYQPACNKPCRIYAFHEPMSQNQLAAFIADVNNTGFMTDTIRQALPETHAKDRVVTREHDAEKNLIRETEANGAGHVFHHDGFNQINGERHLVDDDHWLHINHEHDLQGNHIKTIRDPHGLQVVTETIFNDALGRKTNETDELGHILQFSYQGLRKQSIKDLTTSGQKNIEKDAFSRTSLETDWAGQETRHVYDDKKRSHTVTSPTGIAKTHYQNAFGEAGRRVAGEREHHIHHGVDGQVETIIYPDQTKTLQQYNELGLKTSIINADHHVATWQHNTVGQIEKMAEGTWCDDKVHLTRATIYHPNVFDENEMIMSANGVVRQVENDKASQTITHTTDPDHLQLITKQKMNYSNGLTQLAHTGQRNGAALYVENIRRDILNREISREVDMGNDKPLLLHANTHDKKGNVTRVQQADGSCSHHIFDVCSQLRISIDAEGFVVFNDYDMDQHNISCIQYQERLTENQIESLRSCVSVSEMKAQLAPLTIVHVKQNILDADAKVCFEVEWVQNSEGNHIASLKKYQYNAHGEKIERIEYANVVPADKQLNPAGVASLGQWQEKVSQASQNNAMHDRVALYARNPQGKTVFKRDGEGYITEKRHDVKGRLTAHIAYYDPYAHLQFGQDPDVIRSQLNKTNLKNRATYFVYDDYGNLRYEIDGETYVSAYIYNRDNQECQRTGHATCLKEALGEKGWKTLEQQLGEAGLVRNTGVLLGLMENAEARLKHPGRDVVTTFSHDTAGRKTGNSDAAGFSEKHVLNALHLLEKKIDRLGHEWSCQYDRAKRLVKETSPAVDLVTVKLDRETSRLQVSEQSSQTVDTVYVHDDVKNEMQVSFADNIKDDRRAIKTLFNKKRETTGTQIDDVYIDDGSEDRPQEGKRQETKVNLTTALVRDQAGREIVHVDEEGVARFTLHDGRGRILFHIDGEGYVTEKRYEHAFSVPTHIMRYAEKISPDTLKNHARTGLALSSFAPLFASIKNKDKRTMTLEHDRCGLKRRSCRDAITTAVIVNNNEVKSEIISPATEWSYNAFGELFREKALLSEGQWAVTMYNHDNNGNVNFSVSPNGYAIEQQFGMRDIHQEHAASVCLSRIEHSKPIAVNENEPIESIMARVPAIDGTTRRYDYEYDNRLLKVGETITSGDTFHETSRDAKTGEIKRQPVSNRVHYGTRYDAEKRIIAHESPTGKMRYLKRDARGSVVVETDFPLQTTIRPDDPDSQACMIPLVNHAVNAHQQVVATKKFHRPATITEVQGEIQIHEPGPREEDKKKDQQSYVATDNAGNAVAVQNPKGNLQHTTYNRCKQPVRSYQFVTGYHLGQGKKRERVKHLRGTRCAYDKRRHNIMEEKFDGFRHMQTHRQYNAFDECVAEGPSRDVMRMQKRFDKSGFQWYTNEANGVSTIGFPDANGNETVTFRSAEMDLGDYQDDQNKAKANLLDKPHDETFLTIQRSVLVRDKEGNVLEQHTPWYRKKSEYAPQYQPVSFSVVDRNGKRCLSWKQPQPFMMKDFTHTEFRLKNKDKPEWANLDIHKQDNGTYLVDVSNLPADEYQYELNFHFKNNYKNDTREDTLPSFQAAGTVMLDTQNYAESTRLIWYLQDDATLVLCGKTADITGIELWKDKQPIKRVEAVKNAQGQLIVNLSEEVSGDYDFKVVMNNKTVNDVLHEKLRVRTFKPGQKLTAKEVSVTGMSIKRYAIIILIPLNSRVVKKTSTAFRYEWNTNHPSGNRQFLKHDTVQQEMPEYRQLPKNQKFQVVLDNVQPDTFFPSPGIMTSSILAPGNNLPMYFEVPSAACVPNHGVPPEHPLPYKTILFLDESAYPDAYTLQFTPALPGAHHVQFEYAVTNAIGGVEWLPIKDAVLTQTGMAVPLHSVSPGMYHYRFSAFNAQNQRIDLTAPCGACDKDGWYTGEMVVRKGQINSQVFLSEAKPDVFDIVRPVSKAQYDAWHNRTQETDRKSNETQHVFNCFNQETKTTTPPVSSWDEHNKKTTGALETEHFFNLDGHAVSVKSPNGGENRRIVNARENTLYHTDADFQATAALDKKIGTAQFHKVDVFGHHLEVASVGGGRATSDFVSENGLTTETRVHPGGGKEVIVTNEANERIHHQDRAGLETCYDHDGDGHEIFVIDPLNHTEARSYDMRTGVQTANRDKDGYLQTWALDDYFGNVQSHQDISGQKVDYQYNFNQQIVSEKGDLSQTIEGSNEEDGLDTDISGPTHITERTRKLPRGSTTEGKTTPPLPKDIKNNYDEAGHLVEIFDRSEQLRTIKSYDEDDYCDMYYFINKDGRVHQCVNIERDALQRIQSLQDTKIVIEIGYDQNSNRRYATAHMMGEKPTEDNAVRTSWYDYTVGNRVILRDCVLQGENIAVAPGQGMKLDYRMNNIITQTTRNESGNLEVKDLDYHESTSLLHRIKTNEMPGGGKPRLLSDVTREIDQVTQRCNEVRQLKKDFSKKKTTVTTDKTIYKKNSQDIEFQLHNEMNADFGSKPEDMEKTTNLRRINTTTNTGRVINEASFFSGSLKYKDKDKKEKRIPFQLVDKAHHDYYASRDGARERDVSVHRNFHCDNKDVKYDKSIPVEATQTTTQDANGNYASVRGPKVPGSENDSYRSFVTNSEDCIVFKQTQSGRNYYIYAEKKPGKMVLMAYFGDLMDKDDYVLSPYRPKIVNLNTNHQALSQHYPPPAPMEYTVPRRMTYQELAEELNYTGYAGQIAEANNKYEGDTIEAGEKVMVPPLYFEVPETAWNGKMPSVDTIIGSLYPALPSPCIWLEPKKPRHNWLATFLEVAAFAAIMIYLPGAMFVNPTFIQAFLGYALAGAAGNTVDQVIAAGFGEQSGFNIRNVFTTALTSGISGGILYANNMLAKGTSVLQNFAKADLQTSILVAEEVTVAQHAALLATGMEKKFDWRVLGVSAFNAAAGYKISEVVSSKTNPALNAGLNAGITGVGDSLIMNQKIDVTQLSANVAGTMVGNYAANALLEATKARNQMKKKAEEATKYEANMDKTKAEAKNREQHKLFSANKQQKTKAGYSNADNASNHAWDDLRDKLKLLATFQDIPPFDMNVGERTPTIPVSEESWGMRQVYKLNHALEPYSQALDNFNGYAEPVAKSLVLAVGAVVGVVEVATLASVIMRVAAPFGYASMEAAGVPTVAMTTAEVSVTGGGILIGGAAKYESELLSKLSLFGSGGESAANPYKLVGKYDAYSPGSLSNRNASTFIGQKYSTYKLEKDMIMYRAGDESRSLGEFFTLEKPTSELQVRIDKAVLPKWPGNGLSVINTGYEVAIPKGTIVHMGEVSPQGNIFMGGTQQILIEKPWLNLGIKVTNKFSLQEELLWNIQARK